MQQHNKEMTDQEKIYAYERELELKRDLEFMEPDPGAYDLDDDDHSYSGLLEEE